MLTTVPLLHCSAVGSSPRTSPGLQSGPGPLAIGLDQDQDHTGPVIGPGPGPKAS